MDVNQRIQWVFGNRDCSILLKFSPQITFIFIPISFDKKNTRRVFFIITVCYHQCCGSGSGWICNWLDRQRFRCSGQIYSCFCLLTENLGAGPKSDPNLKFRYGTESGFRIPQKIILDPQHRVPRYLRRPKDRTAECAWILPGSGGRGVGACRIYLPDSDPASMTKCSMTKLANWHEILLITHWFCTYILMFFY
jgi:hypothetical protein